MSLIRNLVVEPEQKPGRSKKGKNAEEDETEDDPKPRSIIKSATDLQRLRLEKLMKNPDKPIVIPDTPSEKDYMQTVPTFVRNVMGSSAGAGSGEFHVYRHLRRKEYARQKTIQAKSMREQLDEEYQEKLNENKRIAEEKTAKKRAKRLKKKQRAKKPREQKKQANDGSEDVEQKDDTSDEDAEAEEIVMDKKISDEDLKNEDEGSERDQEREIIKQPEVADPKYIPEKREEQAEVNKADATDISAISDKETTIEHSPKSVLKEENTETNNDVEKKD